MDSRGLPVAAILLPLLGMFAAGNAAASLPPGDIPGPGRLPSLVAHARTEPERMLGYGIHQAVLRGDVGGVSSILALRPEVLESRDGRGFTPLHAAVLANDPDMVRFLADKGANVNALTGDPDEAGLTPLHLASLRGSKDSAEHLLAAGADPDARDRRGVTPLHIAAYLGNAELAELLADRCADINARESNGLTPLHVASEKGSREVVWMLLRRGADANSRDRYGRTARFFAAARQDPEIDWMIRWAAAEGAASGIPPSGPACPSGS